MCLKKLRSVAIRAAQKVYPSLGLRDSDIILASFPKSGNTWMRFIWANMVSLMELDGREIDFKYLDSDLIAEYDSHSYGEVEFDCLPRIVKTHRVYDSRAFGENRKIYIVRHPGDVAVSFFEYLKAQVGCDVGKYGLKRFIRDKEHGVPAWCEHVQDWRSEADVVVKYEEMKAATEATVHRILQQLELCHVDGSTVRKAVKRSSFQVLRSAEEEKGRPREDKFDSDYRFMRSGTTGEWKDQFDEEDKKYLKYQVRRYNINKIYNI